MELPFHLKTIEPLKGALDILRYFGTVEDGRADSDSIMEALDLSERSFSKAIRRLVTKEYLDMDDESVYRLTDSGQDAVNDLAEYDEATGGGLQVAERSEPLATSAATFKQYTRRMVVALPRTLVAGQSASAVIGFQPGDIPEAAELAVRLSVVNGQPSAPEDVLFTVDSREAHQAVDIAPGAFDKIRVKLKVIQLGPNPGDFNEAGGMYVDIPVVAQAGGDSHLVAYGADITLKL